MTPKLFDAERRMINIVWEHEPMTSRRLVELCSERLGWNKSTTYTVLRKLCGRGILLNNSSVVTSIAKLEDVQRYESRDVMERSFGGSLPQFITAFMNGRTLSRGEAEQLKSLIDMYTEEENGE